MSKYSIIVLVYISAHNDKCSTLRQVQRVFTPDGDEMCEGGGFPLASSKTIRDNNLHKVTTPVARVRLELTTLQLHGKNPTTTPPRPYFCV